ncbi:O-antigen polymerase [Bacillus songklensis]|uniref:O-antigen polymerase n=1 Tax=Bacillus songklensis TaxID=1069116 RepID=A0ABV8B5Q5_9BACI
MYIFTVLVLLLLLIMSVILNRKKNFVLVGFYGIWLVVIILSGLKLYGLVEFSTRVYYVVLIGITGFTVGYIFMKNSKILTLSTKYKSGVTQDYQINIKILTKFLWVILFFYLIQLSKVISLLLNGVSWLEIRYYYYTTGILFNGFEKFFSTWVALPFIFFLLAPLLLNLFLDGFRNKKVFTLALFSVISHIIVTQGKELFIYWFMSICLCLAFNNKRLSKTNKKLIFRTLLFIIASIFIIQFSRNGQLSIDFLYNYLGISMTVMDHWLNYIDENNIMAYGLAFSNGILNIPFSLTEKITGFYPDFLMKINNELNYILSTGIMAFEGKRETTNVYITMFTFFYYDFRYFGVFIESLIFGLFIGASTKRFYASKRTLYHKTLYCIIALSAWCSFIYWGFFITPYLLSFVYLRLLFKKKINRDRGGQLSV